MSDDAFDTSWADWDDDDDPPLRFGVGFGDPLSSHDDEPPPGEVTMPDKPVAPPSITVDEAIEEMIAVSRLPVVASPFATLNAKLGFGGYLPTQVYPIVGGTGRGKTSCVNQHARHFMDAGHEVLMNFYEAFAGYNIARQAAPILGVHSNDLIRNAEEYRERIRSAIPARLHLLKCPTLAAVRLKVDEIEQRTGKPPVVIFDYVQKVADMVAAAQKRPDPRVAMSEVSTGLLELADATKSVVLAVSSMSRLNNRRSSDVRKMAPYEFVDVAKESGAVEYDSAGLIMLSLSNEYEGDERIGTMTLAKSRFGQEAHIDMRFDGRSGGWRDLGEVERDADDDLCDLVREALAEPAVGSTELAGRVRRQKKAVYAAIKDMIESGEITRTERGLELVR